MADHQPPVKRYRREDPEEDANKDDWKVDDDDEEYQAYVPIKERRKQKLVKLGRITDLKESETIAQIPSESPSGNSSTAEEETEKDILSKETSLLLQHSKLKKLAEAKQESEKDKRMKEEERLLQSVKEHTALMGASELAKGIQYLDPIKTSWRPPRCIENLPMEYHEK